MGRSFGVTPELEQITATPTTPAGFLSLYAKTDGNLYTHVGSVESKIWTNNNDGTGSGLDADLLDGQHGSHYAIAGNSEFRQTLNTIRTDIGSPYIRDVALIAHIPNE